MPTVAPFHQVKIDFSTGAASPLRSSDRRQIGGCDYRRARRLASRVGARRAPSANLQDVVDEGFEAPHIYCEALRLVIRFAKRRRDGMRYETAFAAYEDCEPELEIRQIERADGLAEVLAPVHWTSARIDAWLDWADASGLSGQADEDSPLGGAPAAYARRLASQGLARGLFASPADASRFRDDLIATMLGGLAAPADPPAAGQGAGEVTDLGAFEFDAAIAAHLGVSRRDAAVAGALETAAARLTAVIDAIRRCDGDADACTDVARNAALARAARAARDAGVSDTLIAQAIVLARRGEQSWSAAPATAASTPLLLLAAERSSVEACEPAAGRAAIAGWETGRVLLAFDPRDAEAAGRAEAACRAAIDISRFVTGDGFDADRFAAAVRLWTLALDLATPEGGDCRPLGLTLAGAADVLVMRGLAYDSEAGRAAMADLVALASAAGLAASAELATLGAYADFENDREARIAAIEARADACSPSAMGKAAAKLFASALKTARRQGLRNAEVTALFADPALSLRLGGAGLGAAPWNGPVTLMETADGEILRALSPAAVSGLKALAADLDASSLDLLGHRDLSSAPHVHPASLRERGFTDHEIDAGSGGPAPWLQACAKPSGSACSTQASSATCSARRLKPSATPTPTCWRWRASRRWRSPRLKPICLAQRKRQAGGCPTKSPPCWPTPASSALRP